MTASREWIVAEIQRLAAENHGVGPGRRSFEYSTGIRPTDWEGRYWARWGDALTEAGLAPNTLNPRLDDRALTRMLATETRRLGHLPTFNELKLKRRNDPTFPSHNTFAARGDQATLARLLLEFCESDADYADVIPLVEHLVHSGATPPTGRADSVPDERVAGYVYLIKSGKSYKIGHSTDVQRRMIQLNTGMPEAGTLIHTISTDDPKGIESYWHTRFAERRRRPDAEWFNLTVEDVRAFKRRKFM